MTVMSSGMPSCKPRLRALLEQTDPEGELVLQHLEEMAAAAADDDAALYEAELEGVREDIAILAL